MDIPVVKQFVPVPVITQPTAKLIRQDSLLEKGYLLWGTLFYYPILLKKEQTKKQTGRQADNRQTKI